MRCSRHPAIKQTKQFHNSELFDQTIFCTTNTSTLVWQFGDKKLKTFKDSAEQLIFYKKWRWSGAAGRYSGQVSSSSSSLPPSLLGSRSILEKRKPPLTNQVQYSHNKGLKTVQFFYFKFYSSILYIHVTRVTRDQLHSILQYRSIPHRKWLLSQTNSFNCFSLFMWNWQDFCLPHWTHCIRTMPALIKR